MAFAEQPKVELFLNLNDLPRNSPGRGKEMESVWQLSYWKKENLKLQDSVPETLKSDFLSPELVF